MTAIRNTKCLSVALMVIVCLGACKKSQKLVVKKGRLEKQTVTTYQYGTHRLVGDDSTTIMVLTSKIVDLDKYIDKDVEVAGEDAGPPPESGPPLYKVIAIKRR